MYRSSGRDMNIPGFTQVDINEVENRLVIGVADSASLRLMRTRLSSRLPAAAFDVRIIGRTNVDATLQQQVRPLVGGLQIEINSGYCTLGFTAYRQTGDWLSGFTIDTTGKYFVTASHCTSVFGTNNSNTVGQPSSSQQIGTEAVDPSLFDNTTNADCMPGRLCRYSDAALFTMSSGVTMTHGGIAQTSGTNITITGTYNLGSICTSTCGWTGTTVLRKIGRTTGTTTGTVVQNCVTVRQNVSGVDTGRDMICQVQTTMNSAGGDSGAPVMDSGPGTTLHGIHWGRTESVYADPTSTSYATFSPINNIMSEFYAASGIRITPCSASSCTGFF